MTTSSSERAAGDALDSLQQTVELLSQQVRVLVQAVDALTDELQWQNNELRDSVSSPPRPFVLKSLPLDPTCDDWQVNQVQDVQPPSKSTESSPTPSAGPRTLFD